MPPRSRPARSSPASHRPPTRTPGPTAWPEGPVAIPTGTVELVREPDDPDGVTVLVNGVPSSHLDLADPSHLLFEYMQQMAVVLEHSLAQDDRLPRPVVVHLGAAGCALARAVHARHPDARQVAVEIDPTLAELVRGWFDLPRAPGLRIRAGDARAQLATLADASADVVVRDVFAGDRTPEHVTTTSFTADVARVLRPSGLYLANCADRPPLTLARAEAATLAATFAHVAVIAEPGQLRGRRYGNLVLAGTDDPDLLDHPAVARELRSLPVPARILTGDELRAFAGRAPVLRDPVPPDDVA